MSTPTLAATRLNLSKKGLGPAAQRGAKAILIRVVAPVTLLVIWEIAAQIGKSLFFPPPSAIAVRMWELWFSFDVAGFLTPAVFEDILPSIGRMLTGLALATVVGIALGAAIGRSRVASWIFEPLLHFLRSIPGPALLPVFMVLLGTDSTMRVSLIAFGCIWPILLNTIDGVREVDPTQLETARAFALPLRARITKIILPSAGPKIFAGLAVALAIALVLMVISELTVATNGIGFEIQRSQQTFALTDMWAWIALVAILGYLVNLIFTAIERRILSWHRAARRHED